MVGTRSIEQDEIHKESIVKYIEHHVDSISAVLVLADGNVPRSTVDMDYTFSSLSPILPKTLVNNIAFILTNTRDPLSRGFSQEMIPELLKNAPLFLLDNPFALRDRFKSDPDMRRKSEDCDRRAMETLVELLDWLDSLEPQPATEIVHLYKVYQNIETHTTDILHRRSQEVSMRIHSDRLLISLKRHLAVSLSPPLPWCSSLMFTGCRT